MQFLLYKQRLAFYLILKHFWSHVEDACQQRRPGIDSYMKKLQSMS